MVELTPENDDFFCGNESLIKIDRDLTTRICAPWEKFCVVNVCFIFQKKKKIITGILRIITGISRIITVIS